MSRPGLIGSTNKVTALDWLSLLPVPHDTQKKQKQIDKIKIEPERTHDCTLLLNLGAL